MMTRYAPGRAEGVTEELVDALDAYERGPFTEREKAAFRYADRMYEDHHAVDDSMCAMLRDHFSEDEILELSWAIAEFIALGNPPSPVRGLHETGADAGAPPARKECTVAKTIVGLFENRAQAEQLVQHLRAGDTAGEDISLMSPGDTADDSAGGDRATGVAIGAGTGAALGGLGGLLVGLGALAIPGIGPVLAAGPIAAALAGAGLGAAAGGVIGALTDLGIPEEDAQVYAEGVRRGGTLVTVRADDEQADAVMALMVRHGALDVDEHVTRWRQAGWPGFDPAAEPLDIDDGLRIGVLRTDAAAGAMETEAKVGQPAKVEEPPKVGQPVTEPGVHGGIRGTAGYRGARAYHAPTGKTRAA